ncbi:diguanylate cyclase [uncultured Methylibium sp.]|uniref:sensor domain-containing diguanylate cyclase n=1 Tax=uncultured Methylibium sp. TaxID=381093 RepID=UPI0025E4D4E4|nr:diguanylate cyclase [uncultured Methylibium sp.]
MFQTFRARVALMFGVLAIVAMGALSLGLGAMVAREQARDQGDALHTLGRGTAAALAEGLFERMREIELIAATAEGLRPSLDSAEWRPLLDRMQATRPQFAWIGVVDAGGRVQAATGGLLNGQDVSGRPWFKEALKGPHVGDVHPAKLLATLLPAAADGEPLRFIDFAAPLLDAQGRVQGVIGAHGSWEWAKDVVQAVRSESVRERGVQIFILDRAGQVIHHPAGPQAMATLAAGVALPLTPSRVAWSDGGEHLSVAVPVPARNAITQLGWTVVVRQPVDLAMATAARARSVVLVAGALAALAVMGLAWLAIGRFSRPLQAISTAARRIQAGDLAARIPEATQSSELRQLSDSLRGMTQTLVERERALEQANAGLEERVAERTAELERANTELQKLARKDALTGLFNRRAADDRLGEEMARHRRSLSGLSVMLVDIDHFKRVNDTHGHAAGDAVLRELAQRLSRRCRNTDFIARFGGEEFVVLLPDTPVEGALALAEKMRRAVADEPMPGGVGLVTLSIGIASPAEYFVDAAAALAAADEALYTAKRSGRNRAVMYGQPYPLAAD